MGIQRIRQYQRLEPQEKLESWAEKHLKDHAAEASVRLQDFDHTRLGNLHQSVATTASPTFVGLTLSGLTASKPVFTSAAKALTSSGTLGFDQGGTGLTSLGLLNTILGVNAAASALEYKSLAAGTGITVTPAPGSLTVACTVSTSGLVPDSRTISTTSPLSGGGDLTTNRTFSLGGLSALGTGDYVVGVNAGASAWEYKQVAAGTNIGVAHAAGLITISNTAPVITQGTTDITSSLTWDDTWYNFDFTATTSATARWVYLSVYAENGGDFIAPFMFGPTGTAADANATIKLRSTPIGASDYACGQTVWVPLDADQVAAYHMPDGATADNEFVKVLGWI